jgi:hypothetical protein
MIQTNKIFQPHSGCWDYGSTDDPKYSKNPIFKHFFFHAKSNKKPDLTMTHLRIYGRKIISRHFQLVKISYQKLYFHRISPFSAVFIINNLNAWRYKSRTMYIKSLFRLYFSRSNKKMLMLGIFLSDLLKESLNKLFV